MDKEDLLARAQTIMEVHGRDGPPCSCFAKIAQLIGLAYLSGMQQRVKELEAVIQKRECPLCWIRGDFEPKLIRSKDEWYCPNESCPFRFYEA